MNPVALPIIMPNCRLFILFAATGLSIVMSFAQTVMLPYRPVTAEFSTTLDRIVMVSGNPNSLHLFDPVSQKDATVKLTQPPLSLSLSPDGRHAAVGHDSLISYVNLVTGTVEKTFNMSATADSIVLSSAWIYVFPNMQGTSVSVEIATGAVTPNGSVFFTSPSGNRLNTAVNAIYGTRDGTSPNDVEEYDISTGPITRQFDSPYHGDYCIFGPVWFSADGSRIYTACSTVFHASKDTNLDMYYLTSIAGVSSIKTLSESAPAHKVALIQGAPIYPPAPSTDSIVILLDSIYLKPLGQFSLPNFLVNGSNYPAHGTQVFFNAASTELYVVMEADQASGLLNDFAVQRISLGTPAACGASFESATASVPASGSAGTVNILADASCVYQAKSLSPWLELVSGSYGSGNNTLTYVVSANNDSAPRDASVSMGGKIFTVHQEGVSLRGTITMLGYNAVDAANDKPLGKIILVSAGPDELHIYDSDANSDRTVLLVMAPLCVSVRPDGLYAAVGHDGWVSYVNLQTGAVEKVFQVVTDVHHIVLAGNGYMYLFPARDWSDIYSLNVSSGEVTATSAIYNGRIPRLHADGTFLYVGGNYFSKWDISQGVAAIVNAATFGLDTCQNLWLTEDGNRAFTGCGAVYTTSAVPSQDLQSNGRLSLASSVVWADESAQRHKTAVIPARNQFGSSFPLSPDDTQVQIYGDEFLGYTGSVPLPQIRVGGESFATHGRFVFWNKASTALLVIVQADSAASIQSGTGLVQISPSSARNVTVSAVVNTASQVPGKIAPGELVTIYGSGLGPSKGVQLNIEPLTGKVSTILSGTQLLFNGVAAPILYSSNGQVNAAVPYEIGIGSDIVMQAEYQGILSAGTTLTVASAIPGIFTINGSGSGQAAAVNQDGTICDSSHPAAKGSYITVYFTGGGTTNPQGLTGSIAGYGLEFLTHTALATVGNQPATVTFAGAAPTFVEGIGQLNIRLADNTPSGPAQPLILTVDIHSSPATATIAVR